MKSEECPKWETCGAALCPLDKKHLEIGCWYPDDEICREYRYVWIKNQKKIAKKTKDVNKYFTHGMLKITCKLAKGVVGLDPDKPESPQLQKWLESHPPKKELSKAQKKVIVDRFKKFRKLKEEK